MLLVLEDYIKAEQLVLKQLVIIYQVQTNKIVWQ
jgi:hypothetical protein